MSVVKLLKVTSSGKSSQQIQSFLATQYHESIRISPPPPLFFLLRGHLKKKVLSISVYTPEYIFAFVYKDNNVLNDVNDDDDDDDDGDDDYGDNGNLIMVIMVL